MELKNKMPNKVPKWTLESATWRYRYYLKKCAMLKILMLFFLILSATLSSNVGLAENGSKEVILKSQDGNRKLIYQCDAFRHQVKQGKDLRILMPYMSSTMKGLVKNNDVITANALEIAFDREDVRRIERIVVEYRCGLK